MVSEIEDYQGLNIHHRPFFNVSKLSGFQKDKQKVNSLFIYFEGYIYTRYLFQFSYLLIYSF